MKFVARLFGKRFPISAIRVRKCRENPSVRGDRVAPSRFKPPFSLSGWLKRTVAHGFGESQRA